MGDDSIDMVISHIGMGYLVTLARPHPHSDGRDATQLLQGRAFV